MASMKKGSAGKVLTLIALLMTAAIFAMPQGICIRTMLSSADCCEAIATPSNQPGDAKACCKAHAGKEQKTSEPISQPSNGCMATPTDPFLPVDGHNPCTVVVLVPVLLDWLALPEVRADADVVLPCFAEAEALSPALRRGSSILRI